MAYSGKVNPFCIALEIMVLVSLCAMFAKS